MIDFIDQAAGLSPPSEVYAARHARPKVVDATQRSAELFFATDATGLTLEERRWVAWYVCRLSGADALAEQHAATPECRAADATLRRAVEHDRLDALPPGRLRALLGFARKLTLEPIEGQQAAIEALRAAGVASADVVTLAQLIGFLSYQTRVVAGLQAMRNQERP